MPQSTARAVKNLTGFETPKGASKPERVYLTTTKSTRYKTKPNRGRVRAGGSAGMGRKKLAINLGIRDEMVLNAVSGAKRS